MKKAELVDVLVAEVEGLTQEKASKAINVVFETLGKALIEGDAYSQDKFGTFKVVERAARKGRNPQTGEVIDIPAKLAVKFVPSQHLKDGVNGEEK